MSQSDGGRDTGSALETWRRVATGQAEPSSGDFATASFPSDEVRDAYLSRIDQWPEEEVRAVLRNMLGESRNIPVWDELQLQILKQSHPSMSGTDPSLDELVRVADPASKRPVFTEYERRLILFASNRSVVPVWEGLTWVLDLLPHAPLDAINAVHAYITAHFVVVSDGRLTALFDAMSVIRNRYIGHVGATFDQQLELLLSLDWRDFEHLSAALYRRQGYDAQVTPRVKDRGKDVVAPRSEPREVVFVQCKNWRGKVDVDVASALLGRVEQERATRGVLIGTSGFTTGSASATEFASREARLELINGRRLVQLLNSHLGRDWPRRVDRIIAGERRPAG